VRNLVRSEGYARARLVTGSIAMVLGAILIVRTLASIGLSFKVIPACVLGGAMIALGIVRFRDYNAARRGRS
jgi:hypothetical protein